MAYEEILQTITLPSSGDLSGVQYYLMRPTTDAPARIGATTARGGFCLGVLQGNTTATGFSEKVAVYGVTKVAAGDTSGTETAITPGLALIASSVGRAVASTIDIGTYVIGRALSILSTGTYGTISMLLTHQGMSSS